jgi:ABC-type multidrug transport system ATPase subunit
MIFKRGEINCLLGHNGAGKSTLINILTSVIKKSSGKILINGDNYFEYYNNLKIGICPSFNVLFENLTVKEHFRFKEILTG